MKDIIALGKLQNFDNSELINNIDPNVLEEIKKRDPNPLFKAYVVAHEGESKSHVVGIGEKVIRWFKNAVSKVYDKLKIGTPAFSGHNADNSTEGRPVVGRVAGKFQNMVDNIKSVISIIHIYNPFKDENFDCCSFEGDMTLPDNSNNIVGDNDLKAITGIALANTALGVKPAFAGAKIKAAVQMLEDGGKKMELSEIKKGIKEQKITPTMIWSIKELKEFPEINDEFAKVESKLTNQESSFKRIIAERDNTEDENKKLKSSVDELKLKLKNNDSIKIFDSIIEERKIEDPKLKEYIVKKKDNFTLDSLEDDPKAKINTFVDSTIKDFEEQKTFFVGEQKKDDGKNKGADDGLDKYLNQT
jgi:hypothetical protein